MFIAAKLFHVVCYISVEVVANFSHILYIKFVMEKVTNQMKLCTCYCNLHEYYLRTLTFVHCCKNQYTFSVSSYSATDASDLPFLLNRSSRICSCRDLSPWRARLIAFTSTWCCLKSSANCASVTAACSALIVATSSRAPSWMEHH